MKISREVEGKLYKFELTDEELDEAYLEKSEMELTLLIEDNLYNFADDDETIRGIPVDELVANKKFMNELASYWRRLNGHGGDADLNFDNALALTIGGYT